MSYVASDPFDGPIGLLSAHPSDQGFPWVRFVDAPDVLQLSGAGAVEPLPAHGSASYYLDDTHYNNGIGGMAGTVTTVQLDLPALPTHVIGAALRFFNIPLDAHLRGYSLTVGYTIQPPPVPNSPPGYTGWFAQARSINLDAGWSIEDVYTELGAAPTSISLDTTVFPPVYKVDGVTIARPVDFVALNGTARPSILLYGEDAPDVVRATDFLSVFQSIEYSIGMTSFLMEHPCSVSPPAAPMLVLSSIKSIVGVDDDAASVLAVPPADSVATLSPPPPPPTPPFPGPAQRYLVDTATATSVFWYHEHRLYASFNGKTYCRDMLHQENGWTDCGYGYVNARVVTSRFNFPYIAFLSANLTPAGYGDRATGVALTHRSMTPENLYVQIVPNKVIRLRPFDGPDIRRASDKQGLLLKVWGSVSIADCGLRIADWDANPPRVIGELVGRTSNGYEERAPIYAGIYKDGMILEQGFTPAFTSNLLECDLIFNALVRDVSVSQATMEFLVLN